MTDNGKTLEFQIAFPQTAADDKKENDDSKTDNNGNTASDGNATENGSTNNGQNSASSVNNEKRCSYTSDECTAGAGR